MNGDRNGAECNSAIPGSRMPGAPSCTRCLWSRDAPARSRFAALARAAAVELVHDGIRVNVVAPGTIDTAINPGVSEFRRNMLQHRIPIGRAGHVDDVASACLYLASDASRYVTGSTLAVDGGWTAS